MQDDLNQIANDFNLTFDDVGSKLCNNLLPHVNGESKVCNIIIFEEQENNSAYKLIVKEVEESIDNFNDGEHLYKVNKCNKIVIPVHQEPICDKVLKEIILSFPTVRIFKEDTSSSSSSSLKKVCDW